MNQPAPFLTIPHSSYSPHPKDPLLTPCCPWPYRMPVDPVLSRTEAVKKYHRCVSCYHTDTTTDQQNCACLTDVPRTVIAISHLLHAL